MTASIAASIMSEQKCAFFNTDARVGARRPADSMYSCPSQMHNLSERQRVEGWIGAMQLHAARFVVYACFKIKPASRPASSIESL